MIDELVPVYGSVKLFRQFRILSPPFCGEIRAFAFCGLSYAPESVREAYG